MKKIIDYDQLLNELRCDLVRKSLLYIENDQLPGEHFFYINFSTSFPGVKISPRLLKRYPDEITIVVQHEFSNLLVKEDYFSITLYFDGVEEKMDIPYKSLLSFADPSSKFGLRFKKIKSTTTKQISKTSYKNTKASESKSYEENVVILDNFRNK
jgi:uncharacterized protein